MSFGPRRATRLGAEDTEASHLSSVEPHGGERADHEGVDEGDQRASRSRSSWPLERAGALAATLTLAAALATPVLALGAGAGVWPLLLLPTLLATLAARLAFESVDGALASTRRRARPPAVAAGAIVGTAVMTVCALIVGVRHQPALAGSTLMLALIALAGAGLARDLEIRVRLASRRVYFAGSAESLRELRRELARNPEASLVGASPARVPSTAEAIGEAITASRATLLVLDSEATQWTPTVVAATALSRRGLLVRDLLGYYESEFRKVPLTELTPAWFLFEPPERQRRAISAAARRAAVMVAAGGLLVITLPLVGVLMLAVRLTSPGPAIFRQQRVGKDGTLFTLLKLRTMTVADDSGTWATDQDDRITPLGRVLRRYRLDELPQLYNVLRGELALVGPRPEQVPIVARLEQQIPFYAVRHSVRPGLTGWAQVNLGYSGTVEGARAKLQRDLYYVKHRSLRLDMLILWLTLKTIFTDPR